MKSADLSATIIIIKQKIKTHNWILSFLIVSELSGTVTVSSPFLLTYDHPYDLQKALNSKKTKPWTIFSLSLFFLNNNIFSILSFFIYLFIFFFTSHSFHSLCHTEWGEQRGDSCGWGFGSQKALHNTCSVSSFPMEGSKVLHKCYLFRGEQKGSCIS